MTTEELSKVQKDLSDLAMKLLRWSGELRKDLQRNDTQRTLIEQKRLEETLYQCLPLIQSDLNKAKKGLSRFGKLYRHENQS
jgi:hypothetical protein